jgi:photosystem II stability/assembly factor-like uncharacterized protein
VKRILILLIVIAFVPSVSWGQSVPEPYYQDLKWRVIGPFRAGRTVGVAGIPDRPGVFYVGVNNGGVWKTDDFGRTWDPIFDSQPTGSVGDLAVSPSDPDVIYVGTGEGLHRPDLAVGDGMFRSSDGGATWKHIGLDDAQQIASIAVHPENSEIVYVGVLGHPYGPNEMRGIYKSTDGGSTWARMLYLDQNTGAFQVMLDPSNPETVYADMWSHREGPWENASFSGDTSGLFKSEDGGQTWNRLTNGLPGSEDGLGRIGFDISRSDPSILFAVVNARTGAGVYRSDDAGLNWSFISSDSRIFGRGNDFGEIRIHPQNPDILFAGNVASYRSSDGGRTWMSIKGAPGGDDYHRIWINPIQPDIMLFAADQGATITVNGGRTWSSWYNQPTSQLYHVSTDNEYPYNVYGGQQESGAIMVRSRGDGGQITFREFQGVGADEYAYVAPDPLHPDIVFGGRVVKFNRSTGQSQSVAPEALRSGKYRILRTMPLLFSPVDSTALYFATNVLFKTVTGGQSWDIISPDLSRVRPDVPGSIGDFRTDDLKDMPRRGVIYSLGLSSLNADLIWAGTDDGLVHISESGGTDWADVTPAGLRSWDKISQIDAGHFDRKTAYIAVNSIRLDDMRPHVYRTHDGGRSWDEIVNGLPESGPVNVVREDPVQAGLLYAGTERSVYFSVDDGNNWQPLTLNLPASSMRDLVVHGDDIVVGTHGRSIWILDDVTPLRQFAAARNSDVAFLYRPQTATRVRGNMFSDTPLPPEEPTGENPPDGAIFDYFLNGSAADISIEILDGSGKVVRLLRSDTPETIPDTTLMRHPTYWIRPPQTMGLEPGMHRYVWDMRHEPPAGTARSYSIAAVERSTAPGPRGPFVLPGDYTVRLTVDGAAFTQPLSIRMDPRVHTSEASIRSQYSLAMRCYDAYNSALRSRKNIAELIRKWDTDDNLDAGIKERITTALSLAGRGKPGNPDVAYSSIYEAAPGSETLAGLQRKFLYLMKVIDSADVEPTDQAKLAVERLEEELNRILSLIEEF